MAQPEGDRQSVEKLADDVLFGARILLRELNDIYGHVSGRLPAGAGREGLLFARMRIAPEPLDPDEVMELDFSCRRVKGTQHVSGETFIHTEIYKARPDVGGVVHAHPFHAVALSATGRTLHTFNPSSVAFGDGVPVLGSQQINTEKDGRQVAAALGKGKAVILRNHGAVTAGRDVAEAVVTMYYLERAACAHLIAGKDLARWQPDATYSGLTEQSYKFLWRTWRWEAENGGLMTRWQKRRG
ncbi:MAG TPA: class II aldolase/adducin family protein [Candidatus Acidoferrales bacterium]|nr:class II aldolase/adducin family protein [Candidatus Acidoferrales bacterium]